jgi:hypothetical protein
MLIFNKYFYKNKKSKLYFGDRVAVINDFIYQTGGSMLPSIIEFSPMCGALTISQIISFTPTLV